MKQDIGKKINNMYQYYKRCKWSSFKGHFCEFQNRKTSANKEWCNNIVLKDKYKNQSRNENNRRKSERILIERF